MSGRSENPIRRADAEIGDTPAPTVGIDEARGAIDAGEPQVERQNANEFSPPPLEGRHVKLRPVTPRDYELIQSLELGSDLSVRWRFRGSTPSPEQWAQTLWRGVIAQFLVLSPRQQRPVGIVMAYNANFQDQYAYVAGARFEPQKPSPVMMLGFGMFIHYVFTCWQFRKLYLESSEYNYEQFASGVGRHFEVEARLRHHSYFGGRYWDQLTLAMYRDTWMELGTRLLAAEAPAGPAATRGPMPPAPPVPPAPPGRST